MTRTRRSLLSVLLLSPAVAFVRAQAPAPVQDLDHPQGTNAGIFAFTGRCPTCHDTGKNGAPDRYEVLSEESGHGFAD